MPHTETALKSDPRPLSSSNRPAAVAICLSLLCTTAALANDRDRKIAAGHLAAEIEQAQFHKVYVPDFLDSSGARTEIGCFFASSFSTNLAKGSHNFEIINRIQAQMQLDELHISPQDLLKPESLSKVAEALSADAVLVGTATISPTDAKLVLSLRNASGKEVHSMNYHEELEPVFDSAFPAVEDTSSRSYYFPGLDGVSNPKCIYCPNPSYTDKARAKKFQGNVLLSVVVDKKGTVQDVRVVQDPGYGLGQKSVDSLKEWRMEPSRDPQGNPVTIRVAVETIFRLY